eukprot:scaffold3411_cov396-Prasinococcus_capsulatus_cf.AAC.7
MVPLLLMMRQRTLLARLRPRAGPHACVSARGAAAAAADDYYYYYYRDAASVHPMRPGGWPAGRQGQS